MRILIIDDQKEIVTFLKIALRSECYIVDCAFDGKNGSFLARTNEYDAIILDLNLPDKNGLNVCNEIRKDGVDTPIIILSIQAETVTKVELLTAGADDFLTKPFSFQELLARLKAVTRRPPTLQANNFSIGNLNINTGKNEVTYNSDVISLTRKEYTLLEFLAKNQDQVLSRGALMEHVWDMNANPFSNTIEVHIRNIRKKLGEGSSEIIKTISGRGYMLDSSQLLNNI